MDEFSLVLHLSRSLLLLVPLDGRIEGVDDVVANVRQSLRRLDQHIAHANSCRQTDRQRERNAGR